MYTSADYKARPDRAAGRSARDKAISRYAAPLHYLIFAAVILVFGIVYEHFSHEVYTPFMQFAFGFPLLGAALALVPALRGKAFAGFARSGLVCGIATLTVASLLTGIFLIAGTSSPYTVWFWVAGAVLTGAAAAAQIAGRR